MRPSVCLLFVASVLNLSALGLPAAAQVSLPAGGAHYSVTQNGKVLGESQFQVAPVAGGDTLTASGHMTLNSFSYSFNDRVTVDAQGNLVRDELTGSVHGAKASGNDIRFTTASDATGRNFQITIDASGKQSTNAVDRHRNTVIAPDLDPAAYTLMVKIAREQPQTAWVLIPKETGLLVPALYTSMADLNGTLNGQSVAVKHTVVALSDQNSIVIELFATGDGQLLEADLNAQNFDVVRDGFKLLNRPKPVAPPAGEPPQQGDPNAQGAPQGQPQ